MGARVQEVHDFVQPVVDLLTEYKVDDFGWAGVRVTQGLLESV